MAASPRTARRLEIILSALKNEGDMTSILNTLSVLGELLSVGTDHHYHYLISKGGSEALLTVLTKKGNSSWPNYAVLLPLLHLLAKFGLRDRCIGVKAEESGAVQLTLNLLKHYANHAKIAAACLWVIQVFSSSVSTANLIGENHGLEFIFQHLQYTTKHLCTTKAAINAFAALLCAKSNITYVISKGYISGLLQLYEEWHHKDTEHVAIEIRHTLLCCLNKVTNSSPGRHAFISQGGLRLLYHTTQGNVLLKGPESLIEPSVQLMRKCLPKTPLPLTSDKSTNTFPLPGRAPAVPDMDTSSDMNNEESDDEDVDSKQEKHNYIQDDDLETDLNKLHLRPELDRPKEQLSQYGRLCPELLHDFMVLDQCHEDLSSSLSSLDKKPVPLNKFSRESLRMDKKSESSNDLTTSSAGSQLEEESPTEEKIKAAVQLKTPNCHCHCSIPASRTWVILRKGEDLHLRGNEQIEKWEGEKELNHCATIDMLLSKHGVFIPHHEPQLYRATATKTKSIPGFSILPFPDFWGHLPPSIHEPMAPRKANIQRQKVLEDVRRFLITTDIINQVVYDVEDSSLPCSSDSLRFFSNFECGNLRKAVRIRRFEYDLIVNGDANCSLHTQWFYFEVSNMVADVPYRFNVINSEKSNSQFNYGMQPVLYSVREALEGRPHWVRTGSEICYFRNHFCPAQGRNGTIFYSLTFTIAFKHNEDVCYLAYHYPYTYTAMKAHLKVMQKSVDPTVVYFRQQSLCSTSAGNLCPVITITASPVSRAWKDMHQLRHRPCIVLTSRVHPGESNASWVMKGTIEFLCSSDPVAQCLREAFVFKIIPMLNPDGVINGMTRCDLNGKDLNREWCKPDLIISPTIYHTKGFLYYLNSVGRAPLVFCDYHGHSRKKNVFLYGCSVKETLWQSGSAVDTVGIKEDPGYWTIPKSLDHIAPAFSFNSCNFLVEKSRFATARVVVWREIGVLRSYTMESTYNGCDQGIYKGLQTGTKELQEMGVKFCQSLLSVAKDMKSVYNRRLINNTNTDHDSHNVFEDDEPPCVEEIEYSSNSPTFRLPDLDSDIKSNTPNVDEEEDGVDITHMEAKHNKVKLANQTLATAQR